VIEEDEILMTFEEDENEIPEMYEDEPSTRRRLIGCCAILIIIIFSVALIVGYTPWFRPFFP
jgi:hypothetical protein